MCRKHTTALLILVLMLSLVGCGASSTSTNGYDTSSISGISTDDVLVESNSAMDMGMNDIPQAESTAEIGAVTPEEAGVVETYEVDAVKDAEMTLAEEKLVYYCDMEIESKEYDKSYKNIKDTIEKFGGLVQSESQRDDDYDWYYSSNHNTDGTLRTVIKCRIPSENYNEFVESISNLGENSKVISKNTRIENISQQYYDNKTRIDALKIQEERLLQMLSDATEIADMIEVEKRLTDVQYELEQLQTEIIYMDMSVTYSYVNITLEEVKEYTTRDDETTFLSRLWNNTKHAWGMAGDLFEGLLNAILHLIPILIFVIAPIVLFFVLVTKFIIFLIKRKKLDKSFKKFFIGDINDLKK